MQNTNKHLSSFSQVSMKNHLAKTSYCDTEKLLFNTNILIIMWILSVRFDEIWLSIHLVTMVLNVLKLTSISINSWLKKVKYLSRSYFKKGSTIDIYQNFPYIGNHISSSWSSKYSSIILTELSFLSGQPSYGSWFASFWQIIMLLSQFRYLH